jgi:putative hemolysin
MSGMDTLDIRLEPRPARVPGGPPPDTTNGRLHVRWARHLDEVRQAQRLRWRVFAGEMGAQLHSPPGTPERHDIDRFDEHCEHLLVCTSPDADSPGEVVGTYRVLTPTGAQQAGGWYSETEFDLSPLHGERHRVAELGRSCTDPAWRHGGVILMLWSSLTAFMQRNRLDLMIGCASVPMLDGGHAAASLWKRLSATHLAPAHWRVQPRLPLPVDHLRDDLPVEPPPLVKGYLRCGAQVLGAPAWDPDFGVADLPMVMDLSRMYGAYRARLLRGA